MLTYYNEQVQTCHTKLHFYKSYEKYILFCMHGRNQDGGCTVHKVLCDNPKWNTNKKNSLDKISTHVFHWNRMGIRRVRNNWAGTWGTRSIGFWAVAVHRDRFCTLSLLERIRSENEKNNNNNNTVKQKFNGCPTEIRKAE